MKLKKLPILLLAIILSIVIVSAFITNSSDTEESSEPVIVPASEETTSDTYSQIEPEEEASSQVETESAVKTDPEDDYIFYDVPFDLDTQKEIIKICSEFGFSYELILGMISVESSFRPTVLGDGGNSFGLMQIQPRWWSETMEREGVTNLLDPLQNVRCGCAILRELKDKYGTEYRALQAYNTGRPDTNNGYAEKVYRHIGELKIYGG